jgi:hypothetical protein
MLHAVLGHWLIQVALRLGDHTYILLQSAAAYGRYLALQPRRPA